MQESDYTEENVQLTEDQLAERREKITAFYSNNIPHLKVQMEYETLLTDIEKLRVERLRAQMFLAQVYAENNESEEKERMKEEFEKFKNEEEETPKRKLKSN